MDLLILLGLGPGGVGVSPHDETILLVGGGYILFQGKDWDPSNAQRLLEYTLAMNYSATVAGWELGNEPNLFLFNYGFSSFESGEQLVKVKGFGGEGGGCSLPLEPDAKRNEK